MDLLERDLLFFEAMMGAESCKETSERLDLEKEIKKIKKKSRERER